MIVILVDPVRWRRAEGRVAVVVVPTGESLRADSSFFFSFSSLLDNSVLYDFNLIGEHARKDCAENDFLR